MGIIFGYIALALLAFLLAFVFMPKSKHSIRLHQIAFYVLLFDIVVHFGLVFSVLRTRSILVTGTGIAFILLFFVALIAWKIPSKARRIIHKIVAIVSVFLIFSHIMVYFMDFSNYRKKIDNINLEGINLSAIEDGIYYGSYDANYIFVEVKVEVMNHEIIDLSLVKHYNERGEKASSIVNQVINKQDTKVDLVAGATNSSKVILKAIEEALK